MKIGSRLFQLNVENHLTNWRKMHDRVIDISTGEDIKNVSLCDCVFSVSNSLYYIEQIIVICYSHDGGYS